MNGPISTQGEKGREMTATFSMTTWTYKTLSVTSLAVCALLAAGSTFISAARADPAKQAPAWDRCDHRLALEKDSEHAGEASALRPDWFLPELEYELPVDRPSDAEGWTLVREALELPPAESKGRSQAVMPDDQLLVAIGERLRLLVPQLAERAEEATLRAEHMARKQCDNRNDSVRYGRWSASETEGHYAGEMFFPTDGEPLPAGYVTVAGSGWPETFEYHRMSRKAGEPLCQLVRFGSEGEPFPFGCRLLDGEIELFVEDEKTSVSFRRDGIRVAQTALGE